MSKTNLQRSRDSYWKFMLYTKYLTQGVLDLMMDICSWFKMEWGTRLLPTWSVDQAQKQHAELIEIRTASHQQMFQSESWHSFLLLELSKLLNLWGKNLTQHPNATPAIPLYPSRLLWNTFKENSFAKAATGLVETIHSTLVSNMLNPYPDGEHVLAIFTSHHQRRAHLMLCNITLQHTKHATSNWDCWM